MADKRKKKFNWHEARVGLFVVICFAILVFMLFRVTGGRGFFTTKATAVTYLPNIQGLKPGAPVWLNGIEIGNVEAITLEKSPPASRANLELTRKIVQIEEEMEAVGKSSQDLRVALADLRARLASAKAPADEPIKDMIRRDEDRLFNSMRTEEKLSTDLKVSRGNIQCIKMVLKIETDYTGWIKKDSEVSIGSIGLLGDNYVNISIGRLPDPPANTPEGYIYIEGVSEATIHQLLMSANDLMSTFGDISSRVKSIMAKVDKGEGTIGQLVNNSVLHDSFLGATRSLGDTLNKAGVVMNDLHESRGTIGQLIHSTELYDQIKGTITELRVFSAKLNSGGTVDKLVRDPQLYDNLKSVTARLDRVMERVEKGEGTLGKLSKDEAFYAEARDSMKHIHALLGQIEEGKGTMGKLMQDQTAFDNLNQALSELVKFLYDFRQNPKKYLKIKVGLF